MDRKVRDTSKGYLFVVGGPGASGASIISKMLAKHFNLRLVYAGKLFREAVRKRGYEDFESFYVGENKDALLELDKEVDRKLILESGEKDVLLDSKIFSGIAEIKDIPCTVRIWLTASLHVRALRHIGKKEVTSPVQKVLAYFAARRDLVKRWKMDRERYMKLYGIDYGKPKCYNDIFIDSSKLDEFETFDLILKKLKDGQYLKKK